MLADIGPTIQWTLFQLYKQWRNSGVQGNEPINQGEGSDCTSYLIDVIPANLNNDVIQAYRMKN